MPALSQGALAPSHQACLLPAASGSRARRLILAPQPPLQHLLMPGQEAGRGSTGESCSSPCGCCCAGLTDRQPRVHFQRRFDQPCSVPEMAGAVNQSRCCKCRPACSMAPQLHSPQPVLSSARPSSQPLPGCSLAGQVCGAGAARAVQAAGTAAQGGECAAGGCRRHAAGMPAAQGQAAPRPRALVRSGACCHHAPAPSLPRGALCSAPTAAAPACLDINIQPPLLRLAWAVHGAGAAVRGSPTGAGPGSRAAPAACPAGRAGSGAARTVRAARPAPAFLARCRLSPPHSSERAPPAPRPRAPARPPAPCPAGSRPPPRRWLRRTGSRWRCSEPTAWSQTSLPRM